MSLVGVEVCCCCALLAEVGVVVSSRIATISTGVIVSVDVEVVEDKLLAGSDINMEISVGSLGLTSSVELPSGRFLWGHWR